MCPANDHYAYYPGCSIRSTSKAYEQSAMKVIEHLGMTFQEVEDWNCCGATEYFSINSLPAYSLVARNLSLAAEQGVPDLVAPCSACYLNLHKTDKYMGKFQDLNEDVNKALAAGNLSYKPGSLHIRHLLDVIVEDIGFDAIAEKTEKPLWGLRVAPYYGCLIVRPDSKYNHEYPTHLDDLLRALGATVVDFPMKTHCCGGHMTQISEETAYELIRRILYNADEYQADAIATICPMCQMNLDVFQPQVNRMFKTDFNIPILYFTQLMGLAFGMTEKELGFGSEVVSAGAALKKISDVAPEKIKKSRRDKKALPMPETLP
jgi:heterodisulfide reductase subunit B